MKKLLFGLLIAQLALPLHAQSKEHPSQGECWPKGFDLLITVLQVNESQSESFLAIMHEQHKQRKQLHSWHQPRRIEERQEMKALHEQTIEQLQSVLTERQIEAFQAISKQRRSMRKERRRPKDCT